MYLHKSKMQELMKHQNNRHYPASISNLYISMLNESIKTLPHLDKISLVEGEL